MILIISSCTVSKFGRFFETQCRRLVTYPDGLPAHEQSSIQEVTGPNPVSINYIDQSQHANHYTTPTPLNTELNHYMHMYLCLYLLCHYLYLYYAVLVNITKFFQK